MQVSKTARLICLIYFKKGSCDSHSRRGADPDDDAEMLRFSNSSLLLIAGTFLLSLSLAEFLRGDLIATGLDWIIVCFGRDICRYCCYIMWVESHKQRK